jgi:hypothetical protein
MKLENLCAFRSLFDTVGRLAAAVFRLFIIYFVFLGGLGG